MKKLFILLAFILFSLPSYAQIWEGNGGEFIQEGIGFGSNGSGGGGWIPEPLDPNMTHYTISFKDDNETTSLFSPIELNENTVVNLSVFVPTRSEGYDFSHWEDGNGDTVASVTMTADTTVYAVWTAHTHSITWQITDYSKNPVATYTSVVNNVSYGTIIVASSTPATPSGFEFSGWQNLPLTMPDNDLIISGVIDKLDIAFQIQEAYIYSGYRYPIVYLGSIENYSPITYSNGVVNMGDWENWINDHFTPVMLKSDGTVDYELSRSNQNYKADGVTPSDIANANYDGNAMLRIKKFYISCSTEQVASGSENYSHHTIKISDSKKDNTYTCWGFVDANGVEQDYAYYALYCCHTDTNNKLRSLAGITLNTAIDATGNYTKTYSDIVTAAKANGNGWNISNLALENAIGLVIMMVYKEVNPMFISQENLDNQLVKVSADVCKVTGTRSATGGFPYSTTTEQGKALWIENYWTGYVSNGHDTPWCNGLGSLRVGNTVKAYYKLAEPFDFSKINDWTEAASTSVYVFTSSSHLPTTLTLYNNILFPKEEGYARTSYTLAMTKRALGSGNLVAMNYSYHLTDNILPGKTGGVVYYDTYTNPAHFCSYSLYGNADMGRMHYGSGRLTYLPQSN